MKKMDIIEGKIFEKRPMHTMISVWHFKDNKIVFTNGCFDIIHQGHIHVLSSARDLGSKLIVGLNSDNSVRQLKGEGRPINKVRDRALVLASLSFVDAVVVFEEDTPYELIKYLKPNVLVKGGDYSPADIVGADIVQQNGGTVEIISYLDGYSTSEIHEKVKQLEP